MTDPTRQHASGCPALRGELCTCTAKADVILNDLSLAYYLLWQVAGTKRTYVTDNGKTVVSMVLPVELLEEIDRVVGYDEQGQ